MNKALGWVAIGVGTGALAVNAYLHPGIITTGAAILAACVTLYELGQHIG